MEVQRLLEDRVGTDVHMLSITLDPEVDTPEELARYRDAYGAGPGWTFLTGELDDIEHLRRKLGLVHPDPILDRDRSQHGALVVYGNDRVGRWAAVPALTTPRRILRTIEKALGWG